MPVELGDRSSLFFTGKGGAAGIMMDAFMGGAGVAIGIAIDEGIAKDIHLAIQKENPQFDIKMYVESVLEKNHKKQGLKKWQRLTIERYGFQIIEGDFVVPVLEFTVTCIGGEDSLFKLERDSMALYEIELDVIKQSGKLAQQLLYQAVDQAFQSDLLFSCEK